MTIQLDSAQSISAENLTRSYTRPAAPLVYALANEPSPFEAWLQRWSARIRPYLPAGETARLSPAELESELNRLLLLSLLSMAVSAIGFFVYPPLLLLALPGLVYITLPVWRDAHDSLVNKRKIDFYVLCSAGQIALIFSGHFILAALDYALFYLAEKLANRAQMRAKDNLINAFAEQPRSAFVARDGEIVAMPVDQLNLGDQVIVAAGQTIPVDGTVADGFAAVDQRILTGEAQPVERGAGEDVFAGTVVLQGKIAVQVEKTGADTVTSQIAELLANTTDYKAGVQLKGESLADKSALPLLLLGAFALPIVGRASAIAVLFSGFGDSIRVTAPLSVLNFLQLTSEEGILVKDGRALELLIGVDTVVFDKTGTLTEEIPQVVHIYTTGLLEADELLRLAASAEMQQAHPIAKAIRQAAADRQLQLPPVDSAEYTIGAGLTVHIETRRVQLGSQRFMAMAGVHLPAVIRRIQDRCQRVGHSLVYVAIDGGLAGVIELHPTIRPEAQSVVAFLSAHNIEVAIISGDQQGATEALAAQLGIERVYAETPPERKAALISQLQADGRSVCFVGDGINDSIALKQANVSVSLSGASSMAVDTAGIILMDGTLSKLPKLFEYAGELEQTMQGNFMASIVPGVLIVAGAFLFHLNILTAVILCAVGLLFGTFNAMQPMLKRWREGRMRRRAVAA